ncbi:outer membrane beta-barrel protein [Psittacicella hinzii]|uniref:Outer membrane protein beta-barrel domain-containing protein n=1 Tax=Psittacicella hinzii TaxID=2028575 RepID=A0A3A1YRN2_9GAMM|nr:outer membrane beta-barrel protein [Psittacicella hinzii]RIY40156.1 hypothetical protein CKF58_01075 [Psittacicella hinzii]
MKLKTLSVALLSGAALVAGSANAADFSNKVMRVDLNTGFKVSNFNLKNSSVNFNAGSFTLNLGAYGFVYNNGNVAVGLGAEASTSIGRFTYGGSLEHYSTDTAYDERAASTTNTAKRYSDYNYGLAALVQFNATETFTPYIKLGSGFERASYRVEGTKVNFKGAYYRLGAGTSWANGVTVGGYIDYSYELKPKASSGKGRAVTYGASIGYAF